MDDSRITQAEFSNFQAALERWHRTLSAEERCEVIQESALAFCKRFPESGLCNRPIHWLIKSARILASELVRKRIERRECESAIEPDRLQCLPVHEPAANSTLRSLIEVALDELPEHERWAVVNCDMLEVTVADAARERRVSRSTVFSWRQRGRDRLRKNPFLQNIGGNGTV